MSFLEVSNLSFQFAGVPARRVLDDVALSVEQGERVGITGVSGVGKTTLLRLIAGQLRPTRGGFSWHDATSSLAYSPQTDILISFRTAWENAALLLEAPTVGRAEAEEGFRFVERAFEDLGLADQRHCHPSELSGGMRQRVQLVQAHARHSRLLLLDEPFSEQDFGRQQDMESLILTRAADLGQAVIIVSHDLPALAAMCDRIFFLGGRPATITEVAEVPPALRGLSSRQRREDEAFRDFEIAMWDLRTKASLL